MSMLAHNGEYPQVISVNLDKKSGGYALEFNLYNSRHEDDQPTALFPTQKTWDRAPFNIVRGVILIIKSLVPDLQHDHEIWMVGEGKRRATFAKGIIAPYVRHKQIDWSNISLTARVGPELVDEDFTGWDVHKPDTSKVRRATPTIPCAFDDLRLVIHFQDVVLNALKRSKYLTPVY